MRQTSTREKILASAYQLFYREGFSRVSVDAIAEATGVTKRTIYYHFKSKDYIVADVLNAQHAYVLNRFQALVRDKRNTTQPSNRESLLPTHGLG